MGDGKKGVGQGGDSKTDLKKNNKNKTVYEIWGELPPEKRKKIMAWLNKNKPIGNYKELSRDVFRTLTREELEDLAEDIDDLMREPKVDKDKNPKKRPK